MEAFSGLIPKQNDLQSLDASKASFALSDKSESNSAFERDERFQQVYDETLRFMEKHKETFDRLGQ